MGFSAFKISIILLSLHRNDINGLECRKLRLGYSVNGIIPFSRYYRKILPIRPDLILSDLGSRLGLTF